MEAILKLLATELSFLYRKEKFKIIDSEFSESFGGSAYIVLKNDIFKIRLLQSRDGILLEFGDNKKNERWYSFDLIQHFFSNDNQEPGSKCDGEINKKSIFELSSNMNVLANLFGKENIENTKKLLNQLEKERAKKLFKD